MSYQNLTSIFACKLFLLLEERPAFTHGDTCVRTITEEIKRVVYFQTSTLPISPTVRTSHLLKVQCIGNRSIWSVCIRLPSQNVQVSSTTFSNQLLSIPILTIEIIRKILNWMLKSYCVCHADSQVLRVQTTVRTLYLFMSHLYLYDHIFPPSKT